MRKFKYNFEILLFEVKIRKLKWGSHCRYGGAVVRRAENNSKPETESYWHVSAIFLAEF